MKNLVKIALSLSFLVASVLPAIAQNTGIHTFFKGTTAEIKNAPSTGTLVFVVTGLDSKEEADAFVAKAKPYAKFFTIGMNTESDGKKTCKITFSSNAQIKILQRFFMVASVSDVDQNGTVYSVTDFFKTLQ